MTAHNEALKLSASALQIMKNLVHSEEVLHDINHAIELLEQAIDILAKEK
jgi:hypothetical protein